MTGAPAALGAAVVPVLGAAVDGGVVVVAAPTDLRRWSLRPQAVATSRAATTTVVTRRGRPVEVKGGQRNGSPARRRAHPDHSRPITHVRKRQMAHRGRWAICGTSWT